MPIRADLKHHYGPEWKNITRPRILERAQKRCEFCGRRHLQWVDTITGKVNGVPVMYWQTSQELSAWSDNAGQPVTLTGDALYCAQALESAAGGPRSGAFTLRTVRTIVGICHLDHNPENQRDDNLKAACAWCHLNYDIEHHRDTRKTRKDAGRPILQLTGE